MAYNGIFGVRPPFPGAAGRKRVWTKLARDDARMVNRSGAATENPAINLERWSQNAADSDVGGVIRAKFFNDVRELTTVAKLRAILDDASNSTEDGGWIVDSIRAGTLTAGFRIGDSIYFNANSDPGTGKIDADDLLISGRSLLWTTPSSVDLTNGGSDDQTAISILSGVSSVSTIEMHIVGVSTNAANTAISIEIGDSGGFHTSGYVGFALTSANANEALSASFKLSDDANSDAADVLTANVVLKHLGSNLWSFQSDGAISGGVAPRISHGTVTLDTELTQLQITTEAGTATFDGGTVYLRYR